MSHRFHPSVLRGYGLRGISGEQLSTVDAWMLGRSFGTVIRRQAGWRIIVGRDARPSSPALLAALADGLAAAGCDVLDVGEASTAVLTYGLHELAMDAGIMVTAGDRPANWNGLVLHRRSHMFLAGDMERVVAIAASGDWEQGQGSRLNDALHDRYVSKLVNNFRGSQLRVVWDCGNGLMGPILEQFLSHLEDGHQLLFAAVDPAFPNRGANPAVARNLTELQRRVVESGSDLGIAFDAGGERMAVIDHRGRVVRGDQLLVILAQPLLAELPMASVVFDANANSSLMPYIMVQSGMPAMARVGQGHVWSKMQSLGSPLAGETSGRFCFANRWHGSADAVHAALRLLETLDQIGVPLATLRDHMPPAVTAPDVRLDCGGRPIQAVLTEVKERVRARGQDVIDIGDLRIETASGWWMVRPSASGPGLVVRAEGDSHDALLALQSEAIAQLALSGVQVPDWPVPAPL